jgi:hypothetical protein
MRPVRKPRGRRRCVICSAKKSVVHHHIGGKSHIAWLTAPLCPMHHDRIHRLLTIAGVGLEYTSDPVERLIRATKAISIFMSMVLEALHEAESSRQRKR